MKTVVHWFRRDLRVTDNIALHEAARRAERVVPVFILEDAFRTGPDVGAARLGFLLRSLEALRGNLAALGYPLVVRRGRSEVELPRLCVEVGAEAVFCNRRYEPYAQARDQRVFNDLNGRRIGFESFKDAVVAEQRDLITAAGKPYVIFSRYAKSWREQKIPAPLPKLPRGRGSFPALSSDPLPLDPRELGHPLGHALPEAGERAAQTTLRRFVAGPLANYATARNLPAAEGTSQLSPHLRCGTIGIRTIIASITAARAELDQTGKLSCDKFLDELIWREFYLQILHNFPHVMKGAFHPKYNALEWSSNKEHFDAWCNGMTGYPIVDAAMRCLNATGWMHNRLRMIVASFLCKDLLINWQWGERYFMQRLIDGDMAANNGGWQWTAGTGTDAAPYFRIFNPVTQSRKCDPDGIVLRRWLPELTGVPTEALHEPWKATGGSAIYSKRIVSHEEQRGKCLAMFQRVK